MSEENPTTDYPAENTTSSSSPSSTKKKPKKLGGEQNSLQKAAPQQIYSDDSDSNEIEPPMPEPIRMPRRSGGRRMVPVHQSRIADRPVKVGEKDSSLKIKIELDLEVEVEIYARVKGDVTIGLL